MRKYTGILSLILLAVTAEPMIVPFMIHFKKKSIQHKMKERLEEENLQTFIIYHPGKNGIQPGSEILVGENMFDVQYVTEQGDGFYQVTGLYDFEETALLNLAIKKQQDEDTESNSQLLQLFQMIQALPVAQGLLPSPYFAGKTLPDSYNNNLCSPFRAIFTPPPQALQFNSICRKG